MKYNSVDIELKEFSKSFKGYNPQEVRMFLKQLASQTEAFAYETNLLKDRLRERELQIIEFKDREETLKNTVVTAQKITESLTEQANKEAVQIVANSKLKAENMLREARRRIRNYIDDISRLEQRKQSIVMEIRTVLETQLKLISNYDTNNFDVSDIELAVENSVNINMSKKDKIKTSTNENFVTKPISTVTENSSVN